MSERASTVEWVETTDEVVIIEECLPSDATNHTVIPILEPAEAPIQKLLDTVVPGENNGFCCEECLSLFQDHIDPPNISGPSFILDFPTAMDVLQRALLTLPFGLMIGRSSIPNAGIGVINHGETLSPGMHFGPYEGEVTTRDDALSSVFSWEIYKGEDRYEYIDGAKDTHSNWMRYVNSARNKEEANLLAVQYKGSILYHCCRTVHAGDELMVWPSSKMVTQFSDDWTRFWVVKLNTRESNTTASTQTFLCTHCQLSFTTETYLQRHIEYFHLQSDIVELPVMGHEDGSTMDTQVEATKESKICSDCGRTFKQISHLKRHRHCVHSNKRPYCCTHCKRTFSQASGLIRHQLVHKKPYFLIEKCTGSDQDLKSEIENPLVTQEVDVNQNVEESGQSVSETENSDLKEPDTPVVSGEHPKKCPHCDKVFTYDAQIKRHITCVHIRPYVCTICQKGFRQYSDLARHLKSHKKRTQKKERKMALNESTIFSCPMCELNLCSVDDLKEHITNLHPDVVFVESEKEEPVIDEETQDTTSQSQEQELSESTPEETKNTSSQPFNQRPQRHEARSKVSALTKLIAPKRRKVQNSKTLTTATVEESAEQEKPNSNNTIKSLKKLKWYSCSRCKHMYTSLQQLRTHKCALKKHKCLQCGAVFSKTGFLNRHEQIAHSEGNSKSTCDQCGRVFAKANNLKQHQKSNSCQKYQCNSVLFPCPFCQFSFTIKNYLIKHIRRHHPTEYLSHRESESLTDLGWEENKEKLYKCSECEKSYASIQTLQSHTCLHQIKILYLCPDCGKGFSNKYGLKQHQKVHTGEKPHRCPHCPKSFAHGGQLNVHLRTHTGEKPYLCTHCGESFRQSGDLKRHERKHTGVRPHTCPECGKSFSRLQSLKAHQMLHQGQRMFKCTQCGKSFSRNYHLRRHHQKMHL